MPNRKFEEFLEAQHRPLPMDTNERRTWWLDRLDEFYARIDSFLKDYTHSQRISISRMKLQINEELTGPYDATALIVHVGSNEINLRPIGTFLIGARGRVDLIGPMGKVHFVLVEQDAQSPTDGSSPSWEWKISTRPPKIKYFDVNREVFLDALMEVVNGES